MINADVSLCSCWCVGDLNNQECDLHRIIDYSNLQRTNNCRDSHRHLSFPLDLFAEPSISLHLIFYNLIFRIKLYIFIYVYIYLYIFIYILIKKTFYWVHFYSLYIVFVLFFIVIILKHIPMEQFLFIYTHIYIYIFFFNI